MADQSHKNIMIMPNDIVNGQRIPVPNIDKFDTLKEFEIQIKAYAKEVGFSITFLSHHEPDGKVNYNMKRVVCTKNQAHK